MNLLIRAFTILLLHYAVLVIIGPNRSQRLQSLNPPATRCAVLSA